MNTAAPEAAKKAAKKKATKKVAPKKAAAKKPAVYEKVIVIPPCCPRCKCTEKEKIRQVVKEEKCGRLAGMDRLYNQVRYYRANCKGCGQFLRFTEFDTIPQ